VQKTQKKAAAFFWRNSRKIILAQIANRTTGNKQTSFFGCFFRQFAAARK
jgi:hypothetical protein